MYIFTRYILKKVLKPLAWGIMLFVGLIIIADFFQKLYRFVGQETPYWFILQYYLYTIPYWLVQISPIAMLLATLFALGDLTMHEEITALQAGGISLKRISAIPLIVAILLSVLSFVLQESVVPPTRRQARYLDRVKIRQGSLNGSGIYRNFVISGKDNYKYTLGVYDAKNRRMENILISRFDTNATLIEQIQAKTGVWQSGKYIFSDGIVRKFDPQTKLPVREEKFDKKIIPFPEKPEEFAEQPKYLEELNYRQLQQLIKRLASAGRPVVRYKVALGHKIAFPVSNLVIILIGVPLGLKRRKASKVLDFGLCICIAFFYWGLISVGESLGENGVLPWWLAAWFANILIGGTGLLLGWRKI